MEDVMSKPVKEGRIPLPVLSNFDIKGLQSP